MKFDQPGFGQINPTAGGDPEGFDVEIAELIVDAIGDDVEIEWVESVSKNREPFIQDGTVDMVVATYTINDTRKEVVDFAGPYFIADQDTMVRADDDSINGVEDLNGKEVCTVKGSTSATNVVAQAPQAKVTLLDGYTQCAEGVKDGRYDALDHRQRHPAGPHRERRRRLPARGQEVQRRALRHRGEEGRRRLP